MEDNRKGITLEICCGGYADAMAAWRGGAKRIELNSALYLGGLTPSPASLMLVKENTGLEVIAMVRPRGGGFCYDQKEYAQMLREADNLLEYGADGLAFGFLHPDRTIDGERTREMTRLIHAAGPGRTAVFHRAFDCTDSLEDNALLLGTLGIDRILTSGGEPTAWEGREMIRMLCRNRGAGYPGILPGCGVQAGNAAALLEATGASQLHSSCRGWRTDPTGTGPRVSYGYAGAGKELAYDAVSEENVRRIVQVIAAWEEREGEQ
ncbi:MAG: copper homeostasis protein CutC [Eubacteriales bacterium]|nr:copper homeostasis protein CutC [Eubacteriales bacterium]